MTVEPAPGRAGQTHRLLNPAILGVACGAILVPLNSTMLAVALPSVMSDFQVGAATVASLVTIYLGTVVIALPLAGTLGDRLGHRRVFLAGVAAFAAASLVAATAGAFAVLLLARVLQAASGALISTSAVALVRVMAPPDRRGAAFGQFDMLVTISAAVGPLVGGLIVGLLDWRWSFLLAAPVATIAALSVGLRRPALGRASSPETASDQGRRPIDAGGLGLLALLLGAVLAVLLEGGNVIGLVAAVAVPAILAVLVWFERKVAHPAIDLRLFTRPAYSAAVAGVLGATVILHATLILVPLLVERILAGDPKTSGLVLLGISGMSAVAAPIGGRVSDEIGRRAPAVIGAVITAVGLGALWLLVAGDATGTSVIALTTLLAVVGIGFGLSGSPRQAAALEAVSRHEVGMAAATYYTGRYLGGVIGASLAGLVLGASVTSGGVALGFALLSAVATLVALVSLALPGRTSSAPGSGSTS